MESDDSLRLACELLHGIDKVPDLADDDTQARYAQFMIDRRYFPATVDEYYAAIKTLLAAGSLPPLVTDSSKRYSEAQLLEFLAGLADHLDQRRPWPPPAFVKLGADQWRSFDPSRPVAQITLPRMQVSGLLNNSFDRVESGGESTSVMVLRLGSGEEAAIFETADGGRSRLLLFQGNPGDPQEFLARFRGFTGFRDDEVVPLPTRE